ncbi:MAG: DUF190 domain-containing protein [Crenarchaeota archaeon]|nr:DUF190 domain-containing protein [Thermoproteota archaeon]
MIRKMWTLVIRFKKNDMMGRKHVESLILDELIKAGVSGATVWTGVDGFGKRGRSSLVIEGSGVNMPMIIETIGEQTEIERLLPEIQKIIGENGLISISEVYIPF